MKQRSQGFAMMSAIFLMILLSVLGGFMVTISNTQQISLARDALGSRAYYAARAGMEWGAYEALRNGNCGPLTLTRTVTLEATPFTLQVDCTPFPLGGGTYNEASNTFRVFQITATATTGAPGGFDRAERQVQAVVSK